MLKQIRRYQKGILGLFAVVFICLAMAGFGLDLLLGGDRTRAAITVNEVQVPYDEFYQQVREVKDRYRRMFGGDFEKIAASLNLNLNQEVVDQTISGILLSSEAEARGLAVGDQQVLSFIKTNFNDADTYSAYLRQSGMSAAQFEKKVRQDLIRQEYAALLADISTASAREVEALVQAEETKYQATVAEFQPEKFQPSIAERPDSELKTYFEDNAGDFQTAPTVEYEFAVLEPEAFQKDVVVTEEDLAFHLTENENKYSVPERVKVRHIQLLYPKESDPAKMAALKTEAEEVLAKARAGESFDSLVLAHSDDITTKALGGSMGWVTAGAQGKEFDAAVFKLKAPGTADLISTDTGYRIVQVEEYQPRKVKELSEVRAEIEKEIRTSEAPAYAATKAQAIHAEWRKDRRPLAEIAAKHGLTVRKTAQPLDEKSDPDAALEGLTSQVISDPGVKEQLIELPKKLVLAAVTAYHESTLPPFEQVRPRIVEIFKKKDAVNAAELAAKKFLADTQSGKDFTALVKESGAVSRTEPEFSIKAGAQGIFANQDVRRALYTVTQPGTVLGSVFHDNDKPVVIKITERKSPSVEELKAKIKEYREEQERENQRTLLTALTNSLKKRAKIDFDQNLLVAG